MPSPAGDVVDVVEGRAEGDEQACFFEANVCRQGAPELADNTRHTGPSSASLVPPISVAQCVRWPARCSRS